jgi:monovalent cation/proton antiporter MnhG/PhaG subunit
VVVTVLHLVAWGLLGVGLVATLLSCIGVLVMPNVFDRLHYTAPASTVGAFGIALSVVVEEGWSAASVKSMFVFVLLVFTNPVLTHATARAARIRQFGHWVALRAERVEEPEAAP